MKFFVAIELFISVGATFGTRTLSDGSESADFDRSGVFGGVGARPVFGSLVYPGPAPFARFFVCPRSVNAVEAVWAN